MTALENKLNSDFEQVVLVPPPNHRGVANSISYHPLRDIFAMESKQALKTISSEMGPYNLRHQYL